MIALFGTITLDSISHEKGYSFKSVGGILYQAGVFAGLNVKARIYSNLGKNIKDEVFRIIDKWGSIDKRGINIVPGNGNQVSLYYPVKGERVEILHSVVPPFNSELILKDKDQITTLMAVFNSGYDMDIEHWRKIVENLKCPIWLDIHSLALERVIGKERGYRRFEEWEEWVRGVTYFQANCKEIASMLGNPEKIPETKDIFKICEKILSLEVKAIFITLGEEGVLVFSSDFIDKIKSPKVKEVIDTTGCGDVFASATMLELIRGGDIYNATKFGIELASETVSIIGPDAIYKLIKNYYGKTIN
ncbi:carbohydrate kinase family protein [Candidatus Aminicenantes bacterium AC-708-M15]|jgi:hypothetical protein|nr:carbohydrate kinase family protein [SCandidatus Aminicenantes bacterium Aminicenantia_JdfR_composite]MCP2596658.1 carbohydrate kinase family protein [Candidatus Aminicenantes bacterium AC-335-G13]MCP2598229.1 carbohydrate kinase family protein [Candidatus Aminicenantes bacterium AC-335-L06]MCP2603938.1 carbohydrate kinase family protein [Candidatus Aminicenantes bacterium AC-708-M15]MCP2606355.1 carbohydrate kinase family protein [Candidatus Aminicenantes bacterium AC-708-I09]MCP2618560.1 c